MDDDAGDSGTSVDRIRIRDFNATGGYWQRSGTNSVHDNSVPL